MERFAVEASDDNGDVVFSAALVCCCYQLPTSFGQVFGSTGRRSQFIGGNLVRQAVAANDQAVAAEKPDRGHRDLDDGLRSQGLHYYVLWNGVDLLGFDCAGIDEHLRKRLVLR